MVRLIGIDTPEVLMDIAKLLAIWGAIFSAEAILERY